MATIKSALLKVVVADTNRIVGESIARLLGQRANVVAAVNSLDELREAVREFRPRVICMDVVILGDLNLHAVRALRHDDAEVAIVVLSDIDSPVVAAHAFRNGATAFVPKTASSQTLWDSVKASCAGQRFDGSGPKAASDDKVGNALCELTSRQRSVLRLVLDGLRPSDIAKMLGRNKRTIESQKRAIMLKFDVHDIHELHLVVRQFEGRMQMN